MKDHDGMIEDEDVKAIRKEIGEDGWGDVALAMFEREPVLAEAVATRWGDIQRMLMETGLTDEAAQPVLRLVIKLAVECMGLQERAKHKLLADFMPGSPTEGDTHAE